MLQAITITNYHTMNGQLLKMIRQLAREAIDFNEFTEE